MELSAGRGIREGVEVRKLHIVYFLSRNGKTEQPHLIRVHHLNRNGVHLRDVKRWLSELRGREMAESFSWSYKRSYKAGCIWQDLVDDDLITPFSDNEYVLKGSVLPSVQNKSVDNFFQVQEGNLSTSRKQNIEAEEEVEQKEEEEEEEEEEGAYMPISNTTHETLQIDDDNISPKPPPRGDDSPIKPAASTSAINRHQTEVFNRNTSKEELKRGDEKSGVGVVMKKSGSDGDKSGGKKGGKEDGHRRRAASVIRSILRCRRVATKDSAMRASRERNGSMSRSNGRGCSERKSWEKKGSSGSKKMTERAAYNPSTEPNCSQCGKPFKPEKLHSHMKSCAALKEKGRCFDGDEHAAKTAPAAASARRPSKVTVTVL